MVAQQSSDNLAKMKWCKSRTANIVLMKERSIEKGHFGYFKQIHSTRYNGPFGHSMFITMSIVHCPLFTVHCPSSFIHHRSSFIDYWAIVNWLKWNTMIRNAKVGHFYLLFIKHILQIKLQVEEEGNFTIYLQIWRWENYKSEVNSGIAEYDVSYFMTTKNATSLLDADPSNVSNVVWGWFCDSGGLRTIIGKLRTNLAKLVLVNTVIVWLSKCSLASALVVPAPPHPLRLCWPILRIFNYFDWIRNSN